MIKNEIQLNYKIKKSIVIYYSDYIEHLGLSFKENKYSILLSRKLLIDPDLAYQVFKHEMAHIICMDKELDFSHKSKYFKNYCKELQAPHQAIIPCQIKI